MVRNVHVMFFSGFSKITCKDDITILSSHGSIDITWIYPYCPIGSQRHINEVLQAHQRVQPLVMENDNTAMFVFAQKVIWLAIIKKVNDWQR
jgi:hypothetical protein